MARTFSPAEYLGALEASIRAPESAAPVSGAGLVASGSLDQLGWTPRPVLLEPSVASVANDQYYAADRTWKTIPEVSSGSIASALGYTPANAANVVPYTGANQAVNLGSNALTAGAATFSGTTTTPRLDAGRYSIRDGHSGNYDTASTHYIDNTLVSVAYPTNGTYFANTLGLIGDAVIRSFSHGNSFIQFNGTNRADLELTGWLNLKLGTSDSPGAIVVNNATGIVVLNRPMAFANSSVLSFGDGNNYLNNRTTFRGVVGDVACIEGDDGQSTFSGFYGGLQTPRHRIENSVAGTACIGTELVAIAGSTELQKYQWITGYTDTRLELYTQSTSGGAYDTRALSVFRDGTVAFDHATAFSGVSTFTGPATSGGAVFGTYVTKIATTLTNGLLIGGLDGTPNLGMFLQTNNVTYPLILQPAIGRVLIGQTADDGINTVQVGGSATFSGPLNALNGVFSSGVRLGTGYPALDVATGSTGLYLGGSQGGLDVEIVSGGNSTFKGNIQQGYASLTPSARHRMLATGQRVSEVGDGAGTWQTGYREEYNAGGLRSSIFGKTPVAQFTAPSIATDLASVITATNVHTISLQEFGLYA